MNLAVGSKVKFIDLISDDYRDWKVDPMAFNYIRSLINKVCKIVHIQKHYEDDGTKTFYFSVEFSCGYLLNRVNSLAFQHLNE